MKDNFAFARTIRHRIHDLYETMSLEQLNVISSGYRNNLAWHLGHIVVSAELLCYNRSGAMPDKEIKFAADYQNGTIPKDNIEETEIQYFLKRLEASLDEIQTDYKKGIFKTVTPYATQTFGVVMKDIETVFSCVALHDTLHYGHMQAMAKLVK